jgi:hypothetical protein
MDEKEESSNFRSDLNRMIDSVSGSASRSKDYNKFVIGLSTGALVFSPSLIEKFSRLPTSKPIILIGWLCLIISIITGVWLLRKQDEYESQIRSIRSLLSTPGLILGIELDFEKFLTRVLVSGFLKEEMSKDPKNEERIKKLKKDLIMPDAGVGKKFLVKMLSVIKEINPAWAQAMDDIVKEAESWGVLFSKHSKSLYIPNIAKKFRQTTVRMQILEKVMMRCFFAGIILITMFSAINFFSIDVISLIRSLFQAS